MDWDSRCEPINLTLFRLAENLVQGAGVDKQVKTTHIIPIWELFWEQMWVEWKMSTQLEGVLRGKETVKYSM
jgi:hypothetical protein